MKGNEYLGQCFSVKEFCTQGDIWQSLEIFLVVTLGEEECYWDLMCRNPKYSSASSCKAEDITPTTKNYLDKISLVLGLENPVLSNTEIVSLLER